MKIWKAGFNHYFYVQSKIAKNHNETIGKANTERSPQFGEQNVLAKAD
jgi:hypothetical protein